MAVTHKNRPVVVLIFVNEPNLEGALTALRQVRAMEAASSLQRDSLRKGLDRLSEEEIDSEIAEARKSRAR